MISHLIETGIQEYQMICNFDSFEFIKCHLKKYIIMFKLIKQWERKCICSLMNYNGFPLGKMQSTHFAWILTVIFILPVPMHTFYLPSTPPIFPADVEIKMLPLSFKEFLDFHDFSIKKSENFLGRKAISLFDKSGSPCDSRTDIEPICNLEECPEFQI